MFALTSLILLFLVLILIFIGFSIVFILRRSSLKSPKLDRKFRTVTLISILYQILFVAFFFGNILTNEAVVVVLGWASIASGLCVYIFGIWKRHLHPTNYILSTVTCFLSIVLFCLMGLSFLIRSM
jgi:uncharacterized membrane protein HdeD (DUF308 family)